MQRHRIPLVSVLCLIALYASAQTILSSQREYSIDQVPQKPQTSSQVNQSPQKAQKQSKATPKTIEIVHTKSLSKRANGDSQVLRDSVILFHEGAYLYSDSAYWNENLNSFEAFGRVRMEQGDTLFLYGKYMHYDGNTRLVKVRKEVVLEHTPQGVTLFTDSLNYDRMMNVGYYFDGGMLVDSLNELTSYWGQYEPDMHMATFKDSVILTNPKFKLYSDRLKYDTEEKTALISTPSTIVSDSGVIYTSKGWYNTQTENSLLLDQSTIVNKEGNRLLRGDSIYYYKQQGYGEVFGNMFLQDTAKHVILRGHYGYYDELSDFALATDSAFAIEYSQGDSLFIHADTLKLIAIRDTIVHGKGDSLKIIHPVIADSLVRVGVGLTIDSLGMELNDSLAIPELELKDRALLVDTMPIAKNGSVAPYHLGDTTINVYREIKAYYGVRFYRSDMQGVCDSLQFNTKDSVLHMYRDPILWNTSRQLSGDTIDIFMNDSTIDRLHVKRSSFSIEQKDSIHFNQLKSRSLKIFFNNKKVNRVLAEGNVETVAFPEEKDGSLSMVLNWLESSYLEIFMNDGTFNKLIAWPKPVGKTTPFHLLAPDQLRLKDFYWYDYLRPLDKHDIFRKIEKKASDIKPKRSSVFTTPTGDDFQF